MKMLSLLLLCTLFFSNDAQNDTDPVTIDFCQDPLTTSNYKNPISEKDERFKECGLKCSKGHLVFGISKADQKALDTVKYVGLSLSFVILVYIITNQIVDERNSVPRKKTAGSPRAGKKESFWDKSLLYHCPYIISFSVFVIIFFMTFGDMTGSEKRWLCNSKDDSFTFLNPFKGKNGSCTVIGILFHGAIMYYMLYSNLLTFIIWRQFHAPFNPLWNIPKKYFHLMIFGIVFILEFTAAAVSAYDANDPMKVCIPGGSDRTNLLIFMTLPFFFCTLFSIVFSCLSFYSIKYKMTSNTAKNKNLTDFLLRLLYYSLGVTGTLGILSVTGWVFYSQGKAIRADLVDYIGCKVTNYFIDLQFGGTQAPCKRGKTMNVFWFMTWVIACFLAIVSQMVLACNQNQRRRLKRFKTTVVENISTEKSKSSRNKIKERERETIATNTNTPNSRLTNKTVTAQSDDPLPDQDLEMQEMNSQDNVGSTNVRAIESNLNTHINENETVSGSSESDNGNTPVENGDDTPVVEIDTNTNVQDNDITVQDQNRDLLPTNTELENNKDSTML